MASEGTNDMACPNRCDTRVRRNKNVTNAVHAILVFLVAVIVALMCTTIVKRVRAECINAMIATHG